MRSKSKIITFNYSELPQEAINILTNSTDEENKHYDFELDGKTNQWKLYLHYDNSYKEFAKDLLMYAQYIINFQNTVKGSDYLDMYIKVENEPVHNADITSIKGHYKNIKFSEITAGTYDFSNLLTEKDVNNLLWQN